MSYLTLWHPLSPKNVKLQFKFKLDDYSKTLSENCRKIPAIIYYSSRHPRLELWRRKQMNFWKANFLPHQLSFPGSALSFPWKSPFLLFPLVSYWFLVTQQQSCCVNIQFPRTEEKCLCGVPHKELPFWCREDYHLFICYFTIFQLWTIRLIK